MKKIYLLTTLLLLLSSLGFARQTARKCTEQDLPVKERQVFIRNAKDFLRTYYERLPLAIDDPMIQESFVEQFMMDGETRYKPEFTRLFPADGQHLTTGQYLMELDKEFAASGSGDIRFIADNISIDTRDFYMNSLISCYIIADYDLTLTQGGTVQYKRRCRAYCLFPKASVSIHIKLMQIEPVKDIVPWKKPQDKSSVKTGAGNTGTSSAQPGTSSSSPKTGEDKPWTEVVSDWMDSHITLLVILWLGSYFIAFLFQLFMERKDWEWSSTFFNEVYENSFENIFGIIGTLTFIIAGGTAIIIWLISLFE